MKKILILFITVCSSAAILAQNTHFIDYAASPEITAPLEGDYVIYRNTIEAEEKIYTIIYIEENKYFMQVRNLSTEENLQINITFGIVDETFRITELALVSGDPESEDLEYAQIDFFNMILHRKSLDVSAFPKSIVEQQVIPDHDYSFLYEYRYWVPICNLYNRSIAGFPKRNLKLIRFGNVQVESMDDVLEFTGIDPEKDSSPTYVIQKEAEKITVFDNISIPLDENWNKLENNTVVIERSGEVHAYIRIISFEKTFMQANPYAYFAHNLLNSTHYVLPVSVQIDSIDGNPRLRYTEYNDDTGRKTKMTVIFYDRGEGISILQFGVLANLYEANKAYFDDIFY